jgi:HK97 family phage major capsid protein
MRTVEEITAAMTALVDGAPDRPLTDDEVTAYEGMEQELASVQRTQNVLKRNGAYNTIRTPAGVPSPGAPRPDTYGAAFENYLRTGKVNNDLIQISNDQSESVPSQGGYLVPDEFRVKLIEKLKAYGGIGGAADRYTTGNGAPVEWPTIDDTSNTGEIVQEGNTFSAGADLVFGSNALSSYSYVAGGGASTPLRVSYELAQDTQFDMVGLITRLLGTRIARLQALHWAKGTGVQQPLGLITGLTPVQAAANTGLTYADLVTWIHSVDPAYRQNARWVFNDTTLAAIEKLVDSAGNPIYRGRDANMALGLNEATLLGYPMTIDQAMPTYVNASHAAADIAIAFGDIKQGYVVRDIKDVQLLVNPYTRMAYRQIEYTAWARADGTQQDTNAYIVASGK